LRGRTPKNAGEQRVEARYLTNENGQRVGVVLEIEEYERLRRSAEEAQRMRRHPGIVFEGEGEFRRATLARSVFDVWEVVGLYQGKGRERLFAEHPISEEQLELALSYYEEYPEEVDSILDENERPLEYWQKKYPNLKIHVTKP